VTTALAPENRLRAHVQAILDRASVPRDQRDDLAEELYGHLWQRWHEAASSADASAIDADDSVEAAIAAFGDPGSLGRDFTRAFHSRVYAGTIGALLPAVADLGDEASDAVMLRLFFGSLLVQDLVLAFVALRTLTPFRLGVTLASLVLSAIVVVLALGALGRAQRWAVRLAMPAIAVCLVEGFAELLSGPGIRINLLAVVALIAALPAIGPELAAWTAESHPIRARLGIPLTALLLGGLLIPPLAPFLPEPTAVVAADFSLHVNAACTTIGSGLTTMTATADIKWDRLDPWPQGALPVGSDAVTSPVLDGLYATVLPDPSFDLSSYVGATVDVNADPGPYWQFVSPADPNWSGAPVVTGPDGAALPTWAMFQGGTAWSGGLGVPSGLMVPQGTLVAGQLVTVQWVFQQQRPAPPSGKNQPMVVVSYAHMDHFLVQAVATCSRPGVGVQVAPLAPWQQ
jgi:hypothetical protein